MTPWHVSLPTNVAHTHVHNKNICFFNVSLSFGHVHGLPLTVLMHVVSHLYNWLSLRLLLFSMTSQTYAWCSWLLPSLPCKKLHLCNDCILGRPLRNMTLWHIFLPTNVARTHMHNKNICFFNVSLSFSHVHGLPLTVLMHVASHMYNWLSLRLLLFLMTSQT